MGWGGGGGGGGDGYLMVCQILQCPGKFWFIIRPISMSKRPCERNNYLTNVRGPKKETLT